MTVRNVNRRTVLRSAGLTGALAISGAAQDIAHAHAARPAAAGGDLIMIIRHAEKPDDDNDGVDADGSHDKHALTVTGWQRAGALAGLFAPTVGPLRPGLAVPDAIYASVGGDSNSIRPQQTVAPTAAKLRIAVHTEYSKGQETALGKALAARSGATLVAWQHEAIPAIAAALGTVTPHPPTHWPDNRYDVVWTFTRAHTGWRFAQIPQLLLVC